MQATQEPFTDSGMPGAAAAPGAFRMPVQVGAGSIVAAADAAPSDTPSAGVPARPKRASNRLSKRSMVMVITQLSVMTRAGVDLADAVRSIAGKAKDAAVRQSLSEVHAALEEGKPLSQALTMQGDRFDGVTVASVAAGEASGRLPDVLSRLSTLMRDDLRTQGSIRSAVSYPLVLTFVTGGVLAAMIFFVLPQFRQVYDNSPAPTPVVTQLLLDFASTMRAYWWAALGVLAGSVFGVVQCLRSESGKRWIDGLCFRAPLLRSVFSNLIFGRLFRLQGVLLESGVPLLEVLQLTGRASKNSVVAALNYQMQQAVLVGREMSSAFLASDVVPEGAAEMIATGESNGQLPEVLQTVGEFFESEGEQRLKEAVKIMEPAIIVVMGVVVGGIVMAIMLPMLDLSTAGSQ